MLLGTMPLERILIVEDDGNVRKLLHDLLEDQGFSVLGTASITQAKEMLEKEGVDLLISDIHLQDGNGLDFLKNVRKSERAQKMIVMTGFASMDSALEAIRIGVFDFLVKPIDSSMLTAAMERLKAVVKLEEENRYLRRENHPVEDNSVWLGESPLLENIRHLIERVAKTDATVLIQGESGVGKEVVARAIWMESLRGDQPFIRVNCAAIPAGLMESEFFGHDKGAFTGAVQSRAGRFELADKGTILLDEVTEISSDLQVKLLRVLQEREFERVGGSKTIPVDVRILATTNRNLADEVAQGRFREDLYYRLNVFPIEIPPLRSRGRDSVLLARHFLKKFSRQHGKKAVDFSPEAEARIQNYSWPGNVRELQNVMERSVILSGQKERLEAEDMFIPETNRMIRASESESVMKMAEMEQILIRKALSLCKGNRTHAADMLGISLRTLRNRLSEYRAAGIKVE